MIHLCISYARYIFCTQACSKKCGIINFACKSWRQGNWIFWCIHSGIFHAADCSYFLIIDGTILPLFSQLQPALCSASLSQLQLTTQSSNTWSEQLADQLNALPLLLGDREKVLSQASICRVKTHVFVWPELNQPLLLSWQTVFPNHAFPSWEKIIKCKLLLAWLYNGAHRIPFHALLLGGWGMRKNILFWASYFLL